MLVTTGTIEPRTWFLVSFMCEIGTKIVLIYILKSELKVLQISQKMPNINIYVLA